MAYGSLWKNCNQKRKTLDIKAKRTKSSPAQLTDCTQLFTYRISLLFSKQKLNFMGNINHPTFLCRICVKNVLDKNKAVQFNLCEMWIHIKCNNLNYLDYRYLKNCDESWYCIECCSTIYTFNSLSINKNFLACCTNTDRQKHIRKYIPRNTFKFLI